MCTPAVGLLSDKFTEIAYGQRKSWHLLGVILVTVSFPFILGSDFSFLKHPSSWLIYCYYGSFISLFQIGWAATQVSHLALIPELTFNDGERQVLNNARYAATILSSIGVFVLAFGLLQSSSGTTVSPSDSSQFALLAYILTGTGFLFAVYFHMFVKEPSTAFKRECAGKSQDMDGKLVGTPVQSVSAGDWFRKPLFYLIGAIYMCARLVVNISQVYLPLFLIDTLRVSKSNVALAPLTVFLAGFVTTWLLKSMNERIGAPVTMAIGIALILAASALFFTIPQQRAYWIYGVVVLEGVGTTTMLCTALKLVSDLIGNDTESGAFVYGALSFLDKLSNGIAIWILQYLSSSHNTSHFYRLIMAALPAGAGLICIALLVVLLVSGHYVSYSAVERAITHDEYDSIQRSRASSLVNGPGAPPRDRSCSTDSEERQRILNTIQNRQSRYVSLNTGSADNRAAQQGERIVVSPTKAQAVLPQVWGSSAEYAVAGPGTSFRASPATLAVPVNTRDDGLLISPAVKSGVTSATTKDDLRTM